MGNPIERKIFLTGMAASGVLVACNSGTSAIAPTRPTSAPTATPSASTSPSATPLPTTTPTPTAPPGTLAVTVVNDHPSITSSNIKFYVYGQDNTTSAWKYVKPDGSTVAIPSLGDTVTPIAWTGTGNTNTLFVPPLTSCRIYMVNEPLSSPIFEVGANGAGPNAPAPWTNDGSQSVYFDYVEYTWNSGGINVDTTQVDGFALALAVNLIGADNTTFGFKTGAVTALAADLNLLGGQYATLTGQMPYRVSNPSHGDVYGFTSKTFLDTAIMAAWNAYQGGAWMTITGLDATGYPGGTVYGTVDGSSNFKFYSAPNTSSTLLGTMASPTTLAESPTIQMFQANGVFVTFTYSDPTYPLLMPAVGNRVSGALNRGVMATAAQPACSGDYPGVAYQNQFANYIHQVATTNGYNGGAYGYPYDDLCGASTDTSDSAPTSMTITINPS